MRMLDRTIPQSSALLGIAQRQIKAHRTPQTGMTINRKPLTEAPKSLGERIRFHRMHKGLTQRQLAANLGVSRWRLHQIESNAVGPSREELMAIELRLGVAGLEARPGAGQ